MILLDSNILIYLAKGQLDRNIIARRDIAHASATKIETLGYTKIPVDEMLLMRALLGESYDLPLDNAVVDQAIRLRQHKKMSLGDAIVAATALEHNLELWTANTKDFAHIDGLRLHNPVDS